jgi:hypothetical protein
MEMDIGVEVELDAALGAAVRVVVPCLVVVAEPCRAARFDM